MGLGWEDKGPWHIYGQDCFIWMQPRPPYCDRGNYLVQLEAFGPLAREIDAHDFWPRLYFDFEVMKSEVIAWLKTRNQFVEGVSEWTPGEGEFKWLGSKNEDTQEVNSEDEEAA